MLVRSFFPGLRYEVNSPLNMFGKWSFVVVRRSADSITLRADSGEIRTFPLHIWVKSDCRPFELVIFKVGSKTVRLNPMHPTTAGVTGSKFTL